MPKRKNADTIYRSKQKRYHQSQNKNELPVPSIINDKLKFSGCGALEHFESGYKIFPQYCDIGTMSYCCQGCGALMWKGELHIGTLETSKFATCCNKGTILLPFIADPPETLMRLLTDNSTEGKQFRQNIRSFNSSLAFASLGVQQDVLPSGPYTFRVCGSVYHRIGHVIPNQGEKPKFSQIYIYDTDNELENRTFWNSDLDRKILSDLQSMMHNCNPYVNIFKTAVSVAQNCQDSPSFKLVLKADTNKDLRRYNIPSASEVEVIIPGSSNITPQKRDIVLYKQLARHPDGCEIMHISETHPQYDPLHYVLIFPNGQLGWTFNIQQSGKSNKQISAMQFYSYHLMQRNNFNILLRAGRLLHQFIVDQYAKIEQERLNYCYFHQKELRAELYQGLCDSFLAGDTDGANTGRKIVLPSSFTGGPRNMHQLVQDAMAIVRRFGKPDLFVTFTCNPKWPEILNALLPGQTQVDRPDLIARVFHQKLKELLKDIVQKSLFGKTIGYVYTVEFQKRGLPHAHILIILEQGCKPTSPEEYDYYVSAEIPNQLLLPQLYSIVSQHLIHGPCGEANRKSPCMDGGKCTKGFPKEFTDRTLQSPDGYPKYRRRDNGTKVDKNGVLIDNRWVVPFNPFLCAKYSAHINVEICSSVVAVKYLYKYVYKGHDRIMAGIEQHPTNEIQRFPEASLRIFHYELHNRSPAIQRLAVHLPDQQTVFYREGHVDEALEHVNQTTLTAWFEINCKLPEARQIPYHLFPEHFTWDSSKRERKQRKRGKVIGRLYQVNPAEGERFYLRLLLHHSPGCTSFQDIRTLPDGSVCNTFKEAACKRGFLQDDEEWHACLSEAVLSASPLQLRALFVTILVFCNPSNPLELWETFKQHMTEDFLHRYKQYQFSEEYCYQQALLHIQQLLKQHSKSLKQYPDLPAPAESYASDLNSALLEEMSYSLQRESEKAEQNEVLLNTDQTKVYKAVIDSVLHKESNENNVFFVDGPGGTGKTFLYNTILARIRSKRKVALAVASSGIAAELLDGGRTAHSGFKIPIPIPVTSTCNISRQSAIASLIDKTDLIIWDEAPMLHKYVFECVHRTLCDLMHNNKPFGGKVILLGGDFRQVLPVIKHGSQTDIVESNLKRSFLWEHVTVFNLMINMRIHGPQPSSGDTLFENYLLSVGNGTERIFPDVGCNKIKLPRKICIESNEQGVDKLIQKVYPDLSQGKFSDPMYKRAILSPRNENVDFINKKVMELFPSTNSKTYLSADSVAEPSQVTLYPTEFLNSLTPSGIPPHVLCLKELAPVLLLRNLNPTQGLLNGTRLSIKSLGDRVIEATVMAGRHEGNTVFLPRITLTPSDPGLPFDLKLRQFPIRPAFAMSINKAQGQTLECIGINLSEPVFTHGQLYVAMSRVRSFDALAVLPQAGLKLDEQYYTDNVVYKEVL